VGLFQRSRPPDQPTFIRSARGDDLRVGSAERDITPSGSVYLAGFGMARSSTGVDTRLKVRAMVLSLGGMEVVLMGIDNLGLMRGDVDWIKTAIPGIPNGCVFLAASHTHAAPDLVGMWGWYFLISGRDRSYVAQVREAVAEAVAEARARLAPAELFLGEARLPAEDLVRNSNREGVFDRRFTVLHARHRDTGEPLGTLLNMACHAEVLNRRNTLISADFVGALCDGWKAAGHGQAVFINGAIGAMITPDSPPHDSAGVRAMGAELVGIAEQALAAARVLPVDEVEVRRRDAYLPLRSTGLALGRLTLVLPREAYGDALRSSVGYLRLGSFEAVAVPGEMEPGLAERVRRATGRPDLVIFGLADDEVGYLMSEKDAHDPEYEYERTMSPSTDSGERILRALIR
jgi:hypothetical protein